jgi:hypothetical protein
MESSPIAPTAGVQQSPSQFLESLSLWVHPEARLLICFDDNCKHAISPNESHPTNHLRDKHKIPLSRRKGLSKVLATLDLKNPDQAAPLADGSPEDKRLRSYDGFSCLHCEYRTINLTLIIQHYNQYLTTMIAANIATQCACSSPCTLDVPPVSPELRRNTFFSSVHAFRVRGATVEPLLFLHHQITLTCLSFPTKLKF